MMFVALRVIGQLSLYTQAVRLGRPVSQINTK